MDGHSLQPISTCLGWTLLDTAQVFLVHLTPLVCGCALRVQTAQTETFARLSGISLAATGEPPGRLVFDDLSPEDAPVGSEVLLLGYETE